jgi:alpha-tubulin suppressor-like RCC1 family protein
VAGSQVAVGLAHSVLLVAGRVYTLGDTSRGRLGHAKGAFGDVDIPAMEVENPKTVDIDVVTDDNDRVQSSDIHHIAAGAEFTLALHEDRKTIFAWGAGKDGNLGDGICEDRDFPTSFSIQGRVGEYLKIKQLSCGSRHALALSESGDVFSWGCGDSGRLGHGDNESHARPTRIEAFALSSDQAILQVACGDSHSLARSTDGRVYAWGSGSYGRLGLGGEVDQHIPKLLESIKPYFVVGIACNAFHSVAIVDSRGAKSSLYTWGGGQYGKLGHGDESNLTLPEAVEYFAPSREAKTGYVVSVSAGLHHTVCITNNGNVYGWGYAVGYRCGSMVASEKARFCAKPRIMRELHELKIVDKRNLARIRRVQRLDAFPNAEVISTGKTHTLALADGDVYSWGKNSYGQLGNGYHALSMNPVVIVFPREIPIMSIACGGFHSLAVDESGNLYSWGLNDRGQLGYESDKIERTPRLVEALQGTNITDVTAGLRHSFAMSNPTSRHLQQVWHHDAKSKSRSEHSSVFCWGNNRNGQLGLGTYSDKTVTLPQPLTLPGDRKFHRIQAECGASHTVLLGIIYDEEEERDFNDYSPERDYGDFPKLSEGCRVFTMGSNSHGQLGMNSSDRSLLHNGNMRSPYPVSFKMGPYKRVYPKIRMISAGEQCTGAVLESDNIDSFYAWGYIPGVNPRKRDVPEEVKELHPDNLKHRDAVFKEGNGIYQLQYHQVAMSQKHFLALMTVNLESRLVVAWGATNYGKLGVGNIALFNVKMEKLIDDAKRQELSKLENSSAEIPPSFVDGLRKSNATMVACDAHHSFALSSRSGSIFAWGYASDGRLGLGDDEKEKNRISEQDPRRLEFFGTADDSDEEDDSALDEQEDEEEQARIQRSIQDMEKAKVLAAKEARAKMDAAFDGDDIHVEVLGGNESDDDELLLNDRKQNELSAEYDDDDELKFALALLHPDKLPKDRVQRIERLNDIMSTSGERFHDMMVQYLVHVDGLDYAQSTVDLAISLRTQQLRFMRRYGRSYVPKKMLLQPEREQFRSITQLTELERTISELYMCPCLMLQLYDNISMSLYKDAMSPYARECVMNEFVDLVFSLYDLDRPADRRMFEAFLFHLLRRHVFKSEARNDILKHGELEWHLFLRIFKTGHISRSICRLVAEPLTELQYKIGVADQLESLRSRPLRTIRIGLIEELIDEIVQKSITFIDEFVSRNVNAMLQTIGWLIDVLHRAFRANNRPEDNLIGQRVMEAVASVAIEDQVRRRQRQVNQSERYKQLTGKRLKLLDIDSMRDELLVLKVIFGFEEARDAFAELVSMTHLEQPENKSDKYPDSFKHFRRSSNRATMKRLGVFLNAHLAKQKADLKAAGTAVVDDPDASPDTDPVAVQRESDLLRDYVERRSYRSRHVVQISSDVRSMLERQELCELPYEMTTDDVSPNVNIDTFAVDFTANTIHCRLCGVVHMELPEDRHPFLKNVLSSDHKNVLKATDTKEFVPPHGSVHVTDRECAILWRTLQEKEYREIVKSQASDAAWDKIRERLQNDRLERYRKKDMISTERYEETARMLRRITDAPMTVPVYFGHDSEPAEEERFDPGQLLNRLENIADAHNSKESQLLQNARIFAQLAAKVRQAENRLRRDVNFLHRTVDALVSDVGDARAFNFKKMNWTAATARGVLQTFPRASVSRPRGAMRRYKFLDLVKRGILRKEPSRVNEVQIGIFPPHWFEWFRCSQFSRRQIAFWKQLQFVLFTTDSCDILEMHAVFRSRLLCTVFVAESILRGYPQDQRDIALESGISEQCHRIEYEPNGERIPVSEKQVFEFDPLQLADLIATIPRPVQHLSGGQHADKRAASVQKALYVDME